MLRRLDRVLRSWLDYRVSSEEASTGCNPLEIATEIAAILALLPLLGAATIASLIFTKELKTLREYLESLGCIDDD